MVVVAILLAAVEVGRGISRMSSTRGKSILLLPIIAILPVVWQLIPPPRAIKVLSICLLLMPFKPYLPFGVLGIIPGMDELGLWGLLMLGMALVFLVKTASRRISSPIAGWFWLAMFVFVLCGLVALLWVTDDGSVRLWYIVCMLSVITCYLTAMLVHNLEDAERLLSIIVGGMIVVGLVMCVFLGTHTFILIEDPSSSSNWLSSVGRLGGSLAFLIPTVLGFSFKLQTSSNAPQLGEYVAMGLAISFTYMLGARSKRGRLMALVATLMLLIILFITQARGALVATMIALAVISVISLGWPVFHRGHLVRLLSFILLVVPTAVLVVRWRIDVDPTAGGYLNRIAALSSVANIMNDPSLIGRMGLRQAAWEKIKLFPFGYGFSGAFTSGGYNNPHNLYLWLLQGSGWVGALSFMLALGGLGSLCLRGLNQPEPRRRVLSIAVLGVLIVVLVEGMGSVVFAVPQITAAFWAVMGVALVVNGRSHRSGIT